MSAPILDAFGKPASFAGGGKVYEGPGDSQYRLSRPRLDREMALMVTREKHRAMMSDARWIYTTFPLVAGAVRQKGQYVSGSRWKPQFVGEDVEWGQLAEAAVRRADQVCNVRGPLWPWAKQWQIGCQLWDIDGDFFVGLTSTATGFPQFQLFEAYRIGTRYATTARMLNGKHPGERVVNGGRYDGARIINGIIYNDAGREIAYRVLGSEPDRDQDVPARDMIHVANPSWFSEGRPFPTIAHAVLDLYDIKETRNFERISQKMNAALAIIEENAAGAVNINNVAGAAGPSTSAAGFSVQNFEGGMYRYIKSGGGKITSHASPRPSQGWLNFDRTVLAGAFFGMDWRIEMLDLSLLSGAPTRGFEDNINTVIAARFNDLRPAALRCKLFQVAKLIERGDIPPHPEWDQWDFTPPPEFTVDAGKRSQTDRENIRAGIDSHPDAIRRRGEDPEDLLRRQAKYLKLRRQIAAEEGVDERELGTVDKPGDDTGKDDPPPPPRQKRKDEE